METFGVSARTSAVALSVAISIPMIVMVGRVLGLAAPSDRQARLATVLFAMFPGSLVWSSGYSEALFLLLAAGSLHLMLRERWVLAGGVGALAMSCRPTGIAVVAAGVAGAVLAREWRAWIAPLGTLLGLAGYFGFLWFWTGNPMAWSHVQREVWGQNLDFSRRYLELLFTNPDPRILLQTCCVLFAAGTFLALCIRRVDAILLIYSAACLAPSAMYTWVGAQPRFVAVAFPLFLGAAFLVGQSKVRLWALLGSFVVGTGYSVYLYTAGVFYAP